MPAIAGYTVAVVILDQHEPEGESARRLLALAKERDYPPRAVEASRGEHDAGLSFRVPKDVAAAFDAERAELWPDDSAKRAELGTIAVDGSKIENDGEKADDQDTTPSRARTGKIKE